MGEYKLCEKLKSVNLELLALTDRTEANEQILKKLLQGKKARLQWIPREENSEADMLSRVAYKRYLKNKLQNSG